MLKGVREGATTSFESFSHADGGRNKLVSTWLKKLGGGGGNTSFIRSEGGGG